MSKLVTPFCIVVVVCGCVVSAAVEPAAPAKGEVHAVWNHSGTGAYPGDWDRSAKVLADNGFNMILPNMLWGGLAHYASDVLPRSDTFQQYGDQIEQCCAAAKKHGIEVHVWKVNYNLSTAPKEFVEKLRREGPHAGDRPRASRATGSARRTPRTRSSNWTACWRSRGSIRSTACTSTTSAIPAASTATATAAGSGSRPQTGRKVADWPKDCYSGARKDEYSDWRCRQITALVAAVQPRGQASCGRS